jgi:hypothetical protein
MDRGARMALDQQRDDAMPGEEEGGRKTNQAASDDQHGRCVIILRML